MANRFHLRVRGQSLPGYLNGCDLPAEWFAQLLSRRFYGRKVYGRKYCDQHRGRASAGRHMSRRWHSIQFRPSGCFTVQQLFSTSLVYADGGTGHREQSEEQIHLDRKHSNGIAITDFGAFLGQNTELRSNVVDNFSPSCHLCINRNVLLARHIIP